ncbi:hypothetical protein B0J13DRAFT_563173 [Dactylonectria estremocensis]|uniref:Uncharacterized protein n=1 Tax=Dactylonectria estremocensis TaxID=1079267 RepID=A0A9P9E001_9HYPO|nr:hypothetical protein B0J13DRAFT_563173 [Dactylonectria estremocensis]
MSASSGLRGTCSVCSHMYNEHNRYRCTGRDKKKVDKKKHQWVQCTARWYVCQQGNHAFMGDRKNAYLVCHDCKSHPGGGPDGTGPEGSYATADDAQSYDVGEEEQWQWDSTYQRYYCVDAYGNTVWAEDQGQSSSSNWQQ